MNKAIVSAVSCEVDVKNDTSIMSYSHAARYILWIFAQLGLPYDVGKQLFEWINHANKKIYYIDFSFEYSDQYNRYPMMDDTTRIVMWNDTSHTYDFNRNQMKQRIRILSNGTARDTAKRFHANTRCQLIEYLKVKRITQMYNVTNSNRILWTNSKLVSNKMINYLRVFKLINRHKLKTHEQRKFDNIKRFEEWERRHYTPMPDNDPLYSYARRANYVIPRLMISALKITNCEETALNGIYKTSPDSEDDLDEWNKFGIDKLPQSGRDYDTSSGDDIVTT